MREKHLELIHSTINRMASNCFIIKGWCITLVAALCAISITQNRTLIFLLAYIPTVLFSLLDAFYLWVERRYIRLHEEVIKEGSRVLPFSMDTKEYKNTKGGFCGAFFSWSVAPFYIVLALSILIVGVALKG